MRCYWSILVYLLLDVNNNNNINKYIYKEKKNEKKKKRWKKVLVAAGRNFNRSKLIFVESKWKPFYTHTHKERKTSVGGVKLDFILLDDDLQNQTSDVVHKLTSELHNSHKPCFGERTSVNETRLHMITVSDAV